MKIGIDIGGSHVGIGLVDEFGNIQQKKEKYIVEKIEIGKAGSGFLYQHLQVQEKLRLY